MPELKLKDVTLNYEVDDFTDPWLEKKEAVLLHHGCGRNLKYWYRWVPVLARKYKVIRIDARGFGKSSAPGPDFKWSIEAFAGDVVALMDHLEIPQIYFVGEHMGGWTGMQLALDYPQRVRKLVVSTAPHFWTSVRPWLDRIDNAGIKTYVMDQERTRFGSAKIYGKWFAEEYARSRTHVVKSVMQAASGVDYRSRLSDIKCPVSVILGEVIVRQFDPDGEIIASMKKNLPKSSEVIIIKGAPWFVLYTKPEMCAKLSLKFFEKKEQ